MLWRVFWVVLLVVMFGWVESAPAETNIATFQERMISDVEYLCREGRAEEVACDTLAALSWDRPSMLSNQSATTDLVRELKVLPSTFFVRFR